MDLRLVFACLIVCITTTSASAATAEIHAENRMHDILRHEGPTLPDSFEGTEGSKRIAIYNDTGVWSTGFEHLKLFFREYGHSYTVVNASKILAGYLEQENPDVLVMPGGSSWKYLDKLGSSGAAKIKAYINGGGGYVGICAGAFYATSDRLGGYSTGPYGIGLLMGTAYDGTAMRTDPFKDGMLDFNLSYANFPVSQRMILLGGPSLRYTPEEESAKNIQVVGRFHTINEPTMILLDYGDGRVFLSGPHLEVEENRIGYTDPETDWPLLDAMIDEVSLN